MGQRCGARGCVAMDCWVKKNVMSCDIVCYEIFPYSINYCTPLPINWTSKQQQATTSTSRHGFWQKKSVSEQGHGQVRVHLPTHGLFKTRTQGEPPRQAPVAGHAGWGRWWLGGGVQKRPKRAHDGPLRPHTRPKMPRRASKPAWLTMGHTGGPFWNTTNCVGAPAVPNHKMAISQATGPKT